MAEGNKITKTLGIGCTLVFIIGGIALLIVSVLGFRQYKEIEKDMENPVPRAQSILGFETLPEGYHVMTAIAIPAVNETVVLNDKPRVEGEEPQLGDRGFVYTLVKIPFMKQKNTQGLEDFFAGRSDDPSVLKDNNINMDVNAENIVTRGSVESNGATILYIATTKGPSGDHVTMEGLTTLMFIQCEGDKRIRFGVWNTGVMPTAAEDGSLDYTGTVADEAAMKDFLGYFQFCLNKPD